MKTLFNISLAAVLATSSVVAASAPALAKVKHHSEMHDGCLSKDQVGGIVVLGLVLGAVTGGVGSAVVWGGAYAVGGAAIGGAGGLALGVIHTDNRCA